MNNSSPKDLIFLGRIVKVRGLRGELKLVLDSDFPERFVERERIFWVRGDDFASYRIVHCQVAGPNAYVRFAGIDTREQAQLLVGGSVGVPRTEALPLPERQYYWSDLIGCEIRTLDEQVVGECMDVLRLPAQDVLVIKTLEQQERMIPFVPALVPKVEIERKRLYIDPPKGLLEPEPGED